MVKLISAWKVVSSDRVRIPGFYIALNFVQIPLVNEPIRLSLHVVV